MPKAIVLLAEGFEEVEALTPVDLLRRAGVEVQVLGLKPGIVMGSHGIGVQTDGDVAQAGNFDALILPGGQPGSDHLAQDPRVRRLVEQALEKKALVGAICAAPGVVLGTQGFLKGKRFTGFPGTENLGAGATFVLQPVAVDGNIITSRGLGTAGLFALALIETLVGPEKALEIGRKTLILGPQESLGSWRV